MQTETAKLSPFREAQSGRIDAVNEYNQKVQLTFNNLKTDGSSTLASFVSA